MISRFDFFAKIDSHYSELINMFSYFHIIILWILYFHMYIYISHPAEIYILWKRVI